ncbi:hypothetical protein ACEUZ9_001117 [Paracoccus litorisediminis]|uniref:hypothetical protein n=1 Tax=Paracoccus litorisediminis TaxID=2006130 RepID=UPI0037323D89
MSAEELGMEYKRRSEAWQDWAEANPAQPFHNDHAGKSFGDGSPGECADRLEGLRRDGLIFPNEIIVALRAEQREMDGTADPPVT